MSEKNGALLAGKQAAMERRRERFLGAFRGSTGNFQLACRLAGVSAVTVSRWRRSDQAFARDFGEVEDAAILALESEARRRAAEGSDRLIVFLLSSRRPDRYGYRAQRGEALDASAEEIAREMRAMYDDLESFVPAAPPSQTIDVTPEQPDSGERRSAE
jgi:hypothetical protein